MRWGTSLVAQWLICYAGTVGGMGSIPHCGINIPHGMANNLKINFKKRDKNEVTWMKISNVKRKIRKKKQQTDLIKEEWTEFIIHSFIRQVLKVWVGLGHLINCSISCDYIIYQITRLQTTCPLGKQSVKVLQPHTREITAIHINIWDSTT